MALPPLSTGAVQDTKAEPLPGVAATPVGLPGTVAGRTLLEASDSIPLPTTLVAWTVKV